MRAKKSILLTVGIVLFAAYFFVAARPIPLETVLVPRWLSSFEDSRPIVLNESQTNTNERVLLPFEMGNRFGYFDWNGNFSINQIRNAHVSLSPDRWAEYDAEPQSIEIKNTSGVTVSVIDNPRGYPFFLDGRTFLVNSEQNAITGFGAHGEWTYEFSGPLTCVDGAAGLLLTGSLDGIVGILDSNGRMIFSFEPGGSRYAVILGCAISRDGSRVALISGIDSQRFLLLERFGGSDNDYKVVYHEFLEGSFRRPVHISFVDDDRWVVFERYGGLGLFEVGARHSNKVELNGEISAIDRAGGQDLIFAIVSRAMNAKDLVGIRLPGTPVIMSPFKSEEAFLGRSGSRIFVGSQQALISLDIEKR